MEFSSSLSSLFEVAHFTLTMKGVDPTDYGWAWHSWLHLVEQPLMKINRDNLVWGRIHLHLTRYLLRQNDPVAQTLPRRAQWWTTEYRLENLGGKKRQNISPGSRGRSWAQVQCRVITAKQHRNLQMGEFVFFFPPKFSSLYSVVHHCEKFT